MKCAGCQDIIPDGVLRKGYKNKKSKALCADCHLAEGVEVGFWRSFLLGLKSLIH